MPAYVARREVEKAIALEAAKEETLDDAFKFLKYNLDPPIDKYEAVRRFYDLHWPSGEFIDDFCIRLWREAKRADHTVLQACSSLILQLPKQIQQPAKGWLNERGEGFGDKEARGLMVEVRRLLAEKGIAADCGWRQREPATAIALVEKITEDPALKGIEES